MSNLTFENDILIKTGEDYNAVVVSYSFLVEIVNKVHNKLAHIGRKKLVEVIKRHFWHPALETVAKELCRCCHYCQTNKVNRLNASNSQDRC